MALEIAKMLVLSTWHLNHQTAALFDTAESSGVQVGDDHMTVYDKGQWGYIVPILDEFSDDDFRDMMPSDLLPVIDFALAQGCTWLMFDRDADQVDGLPVYEW